MIYQNDTFENTENLFADAVKDLQISKLLHNPMSGNPAVFLLLLVFQGKNLYRFLNSKRRELAVSKSMKKAPIFGIIESPNTKIQIGATIL